MAAAWVGSPPPSTSAEDSADPPRLLRVGAGVYGSAVAPAAAPRSQVTAYKPPHFGGAPWAGQSWSNWTLAGRFGRGATRPLASGPGEVECRAGKLGAGRPILACLLAGGLLPPRPPGLAIPGRGFLCRREGRGRAWGCRAPFEGLLVHRVGSHG